MCLYYKLKKGLAPEYVTKLLPTEVKKNITKHNLRSQNQIRIPRMNLSSFKTSFIPHASSLWNNLPDNIHQSSSIHIFKKPTKPKTTTSNYNKLCSGYFGRLLTRLRLGLSGLNAHRFKYNLHNTPICHLCFLGPEDTYHFFFSCPTHDLPRQHLLNLLQSELDLDTSNLKNILKILLYGTSNHNQNHILLSYIYQYIELTGRFKIQN